MENSNKIAAEIDDNIRPVKDKLYPPHMKGAEQEIQDRTWNTARKWYGDPLPQLVQDRIELELNSIVKNGFSVHYLIAQRLVAKSNKDGYLVGSRGSVGYSVTGGAVRLAGLAARLALALRLPGPGRSRGWGWGRWWQQLHGAGQFI